MSGARLVLVVAPPGVPVRSVVDGLGSAVEVVTRDHARSDLSEVTVVDLPAEIVRNVRDRDDAIISDLTGRVLVDAGAGHADRVAELATLPQASFVLVVDDPIEAVARVLAADPSGDAVTVAAEWSAQASRLIEAVTDLPASRWVMVDRRRVLATPMQEIGRVARAIGVTLDREFRPAHEWAASPIPADAIAAVRAEVSATADMLASHPEAGSESSAPAETTSTAAAEAFASAYDAPMASVIAELGVTLAVSTYQGARLVLCRSDGIAVNTHLRMLPKPMGIAVRGDVVTVGVARQFVRWRRHPRAVELNADSDACYLPLDTRFTGDIGIHEMAYVGDELWFISTRFSCLATLDEEHSFVPRWRPPFVTALVAEDRCHLNGMAVRDGRVASVSALGRTDTAGGWRSNKASGGVILDVPSGEVQAYGLSMPHSPRWRDGELWVCESGLGSLSRVDLDSGRAETVVELPGFTRGLVFIGDYAFVGLSQVRDTVFRGLPIVTRTDRWCGVAVVDMTSGRHIGSLTFTGAVEEVFDVQTLPWRRPDITALDTALLDTSFLLPTDAPLAMPGGIA